MAEYIKRDSVTNLIKLMEYPNGVIECYADEFISDINAIPSADVAEVKHGKWEEGLCYNHYSKGVLESKCSICGSWNLFDFNGYNCESNFCPNCGADMRKGCEW